MQPHSANSPVVRRATTEVVVAYEQLSNKLQQLNRQGARVMSITPC
jgi:phycocyanin-associated rod linker protein